MEKIDVNHDGIIQAQELHAAMPGMTKDVESVVMKLLNTVTINTKNMNFPDFLIFVCQRRNRKQDFTIFDLFQVISQTMPDNSLLS